MMSQALKMLFEHYTLIRGADDVLHLMREREAGRLVSGLSLELDYQLAHAMRSLEFDPNQENSASDEAVHRFMLLRSGSNDGGPVFVHTLALIELFTMRSTHLRVDDFIELVATNQWIESTLARLNRRWERSGDPSMIALPHEPMSTLTKETRNLGTIVRSNTVRAGVAYKYDATTESVLVADRALVLEQSEDNAVFLGIPVSTRSGQTEASYGDKPVDPDDVFGALVDSLMDMTRDHLSPSKIIDIDPEVGEVAKSGTVSVASLVEAIPRVVAGVFLAASQDSRLPMLGEGVFVDSESATRLTSTVGMGDSSFSRNRVATVRTMLERIWMKRRVRVYDELTGKVSSMTWEGPLIQRLDGSVSLEDLPDSYGMTSRSRLGMWRIAPELWRMQDPSTNVAAFMLIDQRAFRLDGLSSDIFNLYWTLVQRANNAWRGRNPSEKFDESGTFKPSLSLLYNWAGLRKVSDTKNKARMLKRLHGHFDILVEHGLIQSFDDSVFTSGRGGSLDSSALVSVTLPATLLRYLSDEAFVSKRNPFKAQRSLSE